MGPVNDFGLRFWIFGRRGGESERYLRVTGGTACPHAYSFEPEACAAVTTTSISQAESASKAWTVARGGVDPGTTHESQTAFIAGNWEMSFRNIWTISSRLLSLPARASSASTCSGRDALLGWPGLLPREGSGPALTCAKTCFVWPVISCDLSSATCGVFSASLRRHYNKETTKK